MFFTRSFIFFVLASVESQEDDPQTIDAVAVAATMPSLDLFSMYSIINRKYSCF